MSELKLNISIKDLDIIDDIVKEVESKVKSMEDELQFLRGLHDYIGQCSIGEDMIENYKHIHVSIGGTLPETYE